MAASTASMWRRSESLSVHSQSRSHAASRERGDVMTVTLARRSAAPPTATAAGVATPPPMEKFVIDGGVPLSGTVVPSGNKNGALPILAAALLTEEEVVVRNVPRIRDVEAMVALIRDLGVRADWLGDNDVLVVAGSIEQLEVDRELSERIRASFLLAGPLLARFGRVLMPPPGGDVIGRAGGGARPHRLPAPPPAHPPPPA